MFNFLRDLQRIKDPYEKINKINNFISQLNIERVKIDSFKEELPLCVSILNDAIEKLNCEIANSSNLNEELVIKNFMHVEGENLKDGGGMLKYTKDDDDKKNWMLDVKLWNAEDPISDTHVHVLSDLNLGTIEERKANKHPNNQILWKFDKSEGSSELFHIPTSLTIRESSHEIPPSVFEQGNDFVTLTYPQSTPFVNDQSKKPRRYWTTRLHDHFVRAVNHLGPAKATPKRIKDWMNMSDLTLDQIKSHLQKYKQHCRQRGTSTSIVPSSPANLRISEGTSGSSSGYGSADKKEDYKY